jgi:Putative lumazine-binding
MTQAVTRIPGLKRETWATRFVTWSFLSQLAAGKFADNRASLIHEPGITFATGFGHVWLLTPPFSSLYSLGMANDEYLTNYDQIVNTMGMYIDGVKQGKSELMRPAFHPDASFFGYVGDQLAAGNPFLFDWIDKNGPADKIQPRMVSVDILESIAVVRLDVDGWSGNLAGSDVYMSDLFTLLKTPSGWRIIQKAFHWHS